MVSGLREKRELVLDDGAARDARDVDVDDGLKLVWRGRDTLRFTVLFLVCLVTVLGSVYLFSPSPYANSISKVEIPASVSRNIVRSSIPQDAPPESGATFLSITKSSAATASAAPAALNVFQVAGPVLGPNGVVMADGSGNVSTTPIGAAAACQVTLMVNSFAASFGKPFVGDYTPPSCIGTSNTVIMNFTATSKGTQFDRLAIMYLGDTEVFRTSTAEPRINGITWEYMKDMSHLMYYWKSPQKVIFDLPNQVTTNLTGAYNTTLIATFFNFKQAVNPASMIISVSTHQGLNASQPSDFSVPSSNATNTITNFPRNANRAVFSISSTGQGNEEFWWSNVLQSDVSTFNTTGGTLFGYSPFREVQLYIDNQLAGVQWPFPVIFTGGVVPSFWSPVVGIDAFDLQEYQIDISPFLPTLCDGKAHSFTMKVAGLTDDGINGAKISQSVDSSWLLTGKIFIWQDSENSITTGSTPVFSTQDPSIDITQTLTQNTTGSNETLIFTTSIHRILTITSSITTQNQTNLPLTWTQTLSHSDSVQFLNFGKIQSNVIQTDGHDSSLRGVETPYTSTYSYPLFANLTARAQGNGTLFTAMLNRGKMTQILGQGSIYPSGLQPFASLPQSADLVLTLAGTTLNTTQNGTATLLLIPGDVKNSFSFGATNQTMRFGGKSSQGALGMEPDIELWFRDVGAVNGTVRSDVERLVGKGVQRTGNASEGVEVDAVVGRQALLGTFGPM